MRILLCILILIAGLSPLLTFMRLFQVKEWRFDRLREHLRHEGWLRQLFGVVKPVVVGVGLVLFFALKAMAGRPDGAPLQTFAIRATLGLLAWFTLFRFVVGKQVWPVWTKKACAVTAVALALLGVFGWFVANSVASVLLPLFAFAFATASLILLTPLDRLLKRRILRKVRRLRAQCTDLTVIGITGSVGKTTTKELLVHILGDRNVLSTPAHVNTELGVAMLMLKKLQPEHQLFIVEMGAYCGGEIAQLCTLTKPRIGIITCIGRQHLGLFGSQEELCHAKGELFAALPPEGHAFLNADTEFCDHLMQLAACPVHTVGTGGHATYEAFDIQESTDGIAFTVRGTPFIVRLQGTHQVTNVLLAAAAAEVLGVPPGESAVRLRSFGGLSQTFEKKRGGKGQIVLDDTHNASPESFRAAIEWARTVAAKRKILVTSGLLELGKGECSIHEELGSFSRDVFDDVVFLSKKCVRPFELGYGKTVTVAPRKKFRVAPGEDMLIVCEGRMPETVVRELLS